MIHPVPSLVHLPSYMYPLSIIIICLYKHNLFDLNHSDINSKSFLIFIYKFGNIVRIKMQYCVIMLFNRLFGRSLVYIMNSKGPNIDPCGTPHIIVCVLDWTNWFLFFR